MIHFDSPKGSCPFEKPKEGKETEKKEETSNKETDEDETPHELR